MEAIELRYCHFTRPREEYFRNTDERFQDPCDLEKTLELFYFNIGRRVLTENQINCAPSINQIVAGKIGSNEKSIVNPLLVYLCNKKI